MHRVRESI
ncbi:UNVERIFIED_CONTAM: hypothetical protein GTU68_050659 [Idotea baltica]|nr:hypothetical protein [Idotea baltica]